MIFAVTLFLIGLMLSAFFSGSETGLYRVSRTRLVLDGLSGSRAAQGLVWLLNHPSIFVATTLVGNNVANYLTSFAIVLAVAKMFGSATTAELLGPIFLTPVVFVLGELLPKYLFYHAPYRLICATRPMLLFVSILFAPISLVLGLLAGALQFITGQTPFRIRLAMARGELEQLLQHGQEAGILAAGQRELAGSLFDIGNRPAVSFGVPVQRLAVIDDPIEPETARGQARRHNHPILLIRQAEKIVGFVRYAELCVREYEPKIRPVIRGSISDRHLEILLRMYDAASDVAVLYDDSGGVRCVVTRRQLLQPLFK